MSRIYNSLKETVQETLQRSNSSPIRIARVKGNHAIDLSDEIEELATIVADRIGRLKAAVKEDEAAFAGERAHAKQVIAKLSENISSLETKFRMSETPVHENDSAIGKVEETLSGNSQNSQKEEDPSSGRDEDDFNSKASTTGEKLKQLEAALTHAVNRATLAEQVAETSKTQIVALEAQLVETEKIIRTKDASTQQLVERLHEQIQRLERQVRNNEELLANREGQVKDFKFKLRVLKNWIAEMSPFFKQAEEALVGIDAQETDSGWSGEHLTEKERIAPPDPNGRATTSKPLDTFQETVSGKFFDRMTIALTHVLGPRAPLIIRGHVAALGESIQKFPKARVAELMDVVSQEITDENLKIGFREVLGDRQ